MNRRLVAIAVAVLAIQIAITGCTGPREQDAVPEEVVRHNILGTAYLGQQKWTEAEQAFRAGLQLRPEDPLLLNNTAVALLQQGDVAQAEQLLRDAVRLDPRDPWAHYNLGLIEKNRGEFEAAAPHFEIVAEIDPDDLLTQYNLGIVMSRIGRDDEAERAFRKALDRNPTHVSSLYGLGRFLLQRGDEEEGSRLISLSQEIRSRSGLDEAVGSQYGEQGPYAMGVDYPGDALAAPAPTEVGFAVPAETSAARLPLALVRLRPDDRPAVLASASQGLVALDAGGVTPLSSPAPGMLQAMAGGDVDGDDDLDVVVLVRDEDWLTPVLARPEDDGTYAWDAGDAFPAVARVKLTAPTDGVDLTLVDRDHDGDLDVFWCWAAGADSGCRLSTNDGSGVFRTESSEEHGFAPRLSGSVTVTLSDFDNDRDIDLVAYERGGVFLLGNQRDGTFEEAPVPAGLAPESPHAVRLADLNKDGWMDLVVGQSDGVHLWLNRNGSFTDGSPIDEAGPADAVLVFDYDNDGFLDVVRAGPDGPVSLVRNLGRGQWSPPRAIGLDSGMRPRAAFDVDEDGDVDLVLESSDGNLATALNQGGHANGWMAVDSRGVGDNHFGIGAKVEVLAGGLRQKFEIVDPVPLHVGLGDRDRAESVRYLWPSGVLQDEIELQAGRRVEIEQLDRKGTSCPLLYVWRGGAWRFVTDFLGGAAVGYLHAPGVYGTPDTDEYVKIEGGIEPDDGWLRLRLNNQLEEVLWFDQFELLAVDHPSGTEVYPNERLMPEPPWPSFELFASSVLRPVAAAREVEGGRDLTGILARTDGRYADHFEKLPFKGYAEPHTLELDLGAFPPGETVVLLLDGWIDYADSSSNLAAHQAGVQLLPPRLTVADGRGGWVETGHRMGFPAGLPKTMAVELTGLFPTTDHRVRIRTSMRIYWDRARVMVGDDGDRLTVQRLAPERAELRFGGYPAPTGTGPTPLAYDPAQVASLAPWKAHVGAYTAFGDVLDPLARIDDHFVTTRHGDEIELHFRAPARPAPGYDRTYLMFADGFGKDMDPNSAANSAVEPVPFHGMPSYPYPDTVAVPDREPPARVRLVSEPPGGWSAALPRPLAAESARSHAR